MRPGGGDIEIHYTGLSLMAPEKVRFKYRLGGYNEDWVDAGARRVAFYTNLSPGTYVFSVAACNNDGVWSTRDASIQIIVIPPFWRTWWFIALATLTAILVVAGMVIGAAILVHRRRISQLQRAHAAQKAFSTQLIASQESERKRIASELHDGLGQNLLIVNNNAVLGLNMTEGGSPVQKQFDEISTMTLQTLAEVRKIIHGLRPHHLDHLGLREALEFMIEKVMYSSPIRFSTEIEQIDGVFPKEAEMSMYRIVQESVNNIIKHSSATEAKVTLKRNGRTVQLMVEDNGVGFDSNPRASSESHHFGLGLTGISERAHMLGGREVIHSVPGQGTIITVTVMLKNGYHEN